MVENPLRRDFRAVSHKINRDFPKSIIDAVDDHFDLGDTYGAFIEKLHHRNEHLKKLNRRHNQDMSPQVKRKVSESFGCELKTWLPDLDADERKALELLKKNVAEKQLADKDAAKAMNDLYPLLRQQVCDIKNKMPLMPEFTKEYPHLPNGLVLREHFEKLTNINIFETGENNWRNVLGDLLKMPSILKSEKMSSITEDLKLKKQEPHALFVTALRFLFEGLKENIDDFIFLLPVSIDCSGIVDISTVTDVSI